MSIESDNYAAAQAAARAARRRRIMAEVSSLNGQISRLQGEIRELEQEIRQVEGYKAQGEATMSSASMHTTSIGNLREDAVCYGDAAEKHSDHCNGGKAASLAGVFNQRIEELKRKKEQLERQVREKESRKSSLLSQL